MTCQKKTNLVALIRRTVVLFLIFISGIMVTIDIWSSYYSAGVRADQMRVDFIQKEQHQIKREVNHVARIINFKASKALISKNKSQQDHEKSLQLIIESHVTEHRFGLNDRGYIFIIKEKTLSSGQGQRTKALP